MQRSEKETVVHDVIEIFEKAKSVFVTDYEGLTVEKISMLRKKCRASAVEYRVVKNTLAKMAADKAGKMIHCARAAAEHNAIVFSFLKESILLACYS